MAIIGASITNTKAIENALIKAFETWAKEDINDKHWEKQFRDMSKWNWPNGKTIRKSGAEVDSPRDIYDLGLLYDSGKQSFDVQRGGNGANASWHWDAKNSKGREYARYVHDGTKFMDGRPFTEDIYVEASFFFKEPGSDLVARVQTALDNLNK
jgi:hypothetical protein